MSYFNAKAEGFLTELTADLKMNIAADFKSKKVSAEVFSKFCRLNNFTPDVLIDEERNCVKAVNSVKGQSVIQSFTLTTDKEYGDIIQSLDFEKYGKVDNPLGIPMIEIPNSKLSSCDMFTNDIRLSTIAEISKVLIGPTMYKEGEAKLSITEFSFYGEVSYSIFRLNTSIIRTAVCTPLFNADIDMALRVNDISDHVLFNLKPKFKETYNDTQEALHWIKLILAMFNGAHIKMSSKGHTTTQQFSNNIEGYNEYLKYEEYYKNVAEIEDLSNVVFSKYENYTYDSYVDSQKILSYLKKTPRSISYPNGVEFTFTRSEDAITHEFDLEKKYLLVASTCIIQPIILNGMEFKIPYENAIYKECEITSISTDDNGITLIKVHSSETEIEVLYVDNPIKLEDNTIKLT